VKDLDADPMLAGSSRHWSGLRGKKEYLRVLVRVESDVKVVSAEFLVVRTGF
jgi:hypothetical protein